MPDSKEADKKKINEITSDKEESNEISVTVIELNTSRKRMQYKLLTQPGLKPLEFSKVQRGIRLARAKDTIFLTDSGEPPNLSFCDEKPY